MHFRRELDFDDLIETIDQLTDEQIDEVVDWQMTDSEAAKKEKASKGQNLGRAIGSAISSGYTMSQIAAMRSAPWVVDRRDARPRRAVAPGIRSFAIMEPPQLNSFNPDQQGWASERMRYRRIDFDIQTMRDPMMNVLHMRLKWQADGETEWHYQQTAVTWEALTSFRGGPIQVLRANNVLPGRDIVVELDPQRAVETDGDYRSLQLYIEGP